VTLETHLNYKKTVGKSNFTGLLLYTQTKQLWNYMSVSREGYTLAIDEINFGAAANRNNGGYSGSSGRQGIVGRFNWAYADKYFLKRVLEQMVQSNLQMENVGASSRQYRQVM
jgi:hypothetical protein